MKSVNIIVNSGNEESMKNDKYFQYKELPANRLCIEKIVVDCSKCKHHTYDWNVDDDCEEEYELCEKGRELHQRQCKYFEEV